MSVGDLINREERPAYVQFERRAIEDKAASIRDGVYRAKDVDYALVTPPYSKDCMEQKVTQWLENVEKNVRDGRIPQTWADQWKTAYRHWKDGQEMPVNGTPIKGWGVISPSQQETLIRINCRTVEDLAIINDEGIRRLGMGAIELRDKAKTWLASMNDHGSVSVKMAAIEQENRTLRASMETMAKQIDALKTMMPQSPEYVSRETGPITASDILDDSDLQIPTLGKRTRGRPRKV